MSGVYNLKSTPGVGKFIVTKFDDDLNVESSYEFHNTTDGMICHCPAGQRPSCRHRQMFPLLQTRVDSAWMLDFDTRQWVDLTGEAVSEASSNNFIPIGTIGRGETKSANSIPKDAVVIDNLTGFAQGILEGTSKPNHIVRLDDSHPFRRRM